MDGQPSATVPADLEVMSNRLAELEAAQAAEFSQPPVKPASSPESTSAPAADQAAAGNRAPASGDGTPAKPSDSESSSSTPSGPSGQPPKEAAGQQGQQQQQQQQPKPDDQPKGSPFAQDNERRNRSWKELNQQKDQLAKDRAKFEQETTQLKAQLQADRENFTREAAQHKADNSPEAFDKYALAESDKAQKLETLAQQAEDDGNLEKAEELKQAALMARGFERLAKQKAEHLRKNPPADAIKLKEQHAAHVKEWTLKAAKDFPEFGKQGSAVQQEVASFLNRVAQQWPEAAKLPGLVYYAAERAALKVGADRVPGLEKELGELKKKVTELESLTSTAPPGGVPKLPTSGSKSFDEMSSEDQFESLKADAATTVR